jgi:large subunit ribosomal protein L10
MNKEEKHDLVLALTDQMKEYGNFYITDTADLTVAKVNNIRRQCFESDITMLVAKNSLIKKAMEAAEGDYARYMMY